MFYIVQMCNMNEILTSFHCHVTHSIASLHFQSHILSRGLIGYKVECTFQNLSRNNRSSGYFSPALECFEYGHTTCLTYCFSFTVYNRSTK